MRKKLNVTFEGTKDTTGYLHSLVKCLSAALRCGGYEDYADDVVAGSGFAFRVWAEKNLCPSAMSVWEFRKQKPWVENCGLTCDYAERLWDQEAVKEERRLAAVEIIRQSIDRGMAAVVWDVGDCEWGLVAGYDDEQELFYSLRIDGSEDSFAYEKLGLFEIPILSVLTVTGARDKAAEQGESAEQLVADTKKLAAAHLRGEEWCENACGLAAYDTIVNYITEHSLEDGCWSLEYYLGTYAALKYHAWKFFEKYQEEELCKVYQEIYDAWKQAFDIKCSRDITDSEVKAQIVGLLGLAKSAEWKAAEIMSCQ